MEEQSDESCKQTQMKNSTNFLVNNNDGKKMSGENEEGKKVTEEILKEGKKFIGWYLDFDFDDNPFWVEKNIETRKSVDGMCNDILDMVSLFKRTEDTVNKKIMKKFQDAFILHMSVEENVGLKMEKEIMAISETENLEIFQDGSIVMNEAKRETINMLISLRYFEKMFKDIGAKGPILTEQTVLEGHKILMSNLITSAGRLSEKERETDCPILNKTIKYPSPTFVERTLPTFLDTANYMATYLNHRRLREKWSPDLLKKMIQYCAWFFYNFVSLHPFGDGNGRMARLLYCYLQYMISPFPVGIYNIFATTKKIDYMKAICDTRERLHTDLKKTRNVEGLKEGWSLDAKPAELSTMIMECQWHAWNQYKLELENNGIEFQ